MKTILFYLIFASVHFVGISQTISVNKELKIPEMDSTNWVYPWHVIKHNDGHFENTFGTPIGQEDTIHIVKNAQVFAHHQDFKYPIPFAQSTLHEDTLIIQLLDESASNFETLSIRIVDGKFELEYDKAYIQKLKEWNVQFTEQSITLNQNQFEIGEKVKGDVHIKLLETLVWPDDTSETIEKEIIGTFTTILVSKNQ